MKAINIYTYSRIQENMATELENILKIFLLLFIINDELMGAELKKKVVRNGLKLLQLICGKACAGSSIG